MAKRSVEQKSTKTRAEWYKDWAKRNPEKIREYQQRYREKKKKEQKEFEKKEFGNISDIA